MIRPLFALFAPIVLAGLAANASAVDSWTIDSVHTSALFKIQHVGAGNFYGRFNDIAGTLTLDAADASKNAVTITIKIDSVDTKTPKLDEHLKSPDFFSAKEFPNLTFVSKSMTPAGSDVYDVVGELTLHGVTKPVTVKAVKVGQKGDRIGLETAFTIKRSEFGMKFMLDRLPDDVGIIFSLEAIAKK